MGGVQYQVIFPLLSNMHTVLLLNIDSKIVGGYEQAGAAALVFQASVLAMAVLVYLSNPLGHQGSLVVFLFLIVSQIPIHNS
jgi:hypothetical protein